MKSIEQVLDDAVKSKSEFSKDFKELMLKYKQGDCVRVFVESVIEEAMKQYAKQVAEAQRIDCVAKLDGTTPNELMSGLTKSYMLNTPLVTDNI